MPPTRVSPAFVEQPCTFERSSQPCQVDVERLLHAVSETSRLVLPSPSHQGWRLTTNPPHTTPPCLTAGYRAAEAFGVLTDQETVLSGAITDVKSAADASSRAAVAASAAAAAVAVTKAAAARAAARIARGGGGGKPEDAAAQQQQQKQGTTATGEGGAGSNGAGKGPLALPEASSASGNGAPAAASGSVPTAANGGAGANGTGASGSAPANGAAPPAGSSTVEQLTAMAATMQKLTAEVDEIVHSGTPGSSSTAAPGNGSSSGGSSLAIDTEVKVAAVEAVAAAEAAAITAVAAGDLAGANQVLQDAAAALQSTVAQLAAAESAAAESAAGGSPQAAAGAGGAAPAEAAAAAGGTRQGKHVLTPHERAEEALAAAHAAARQAADAAAVAVAASAAVDARQEADAAEALVTSSSDEPPVGLDAAPAAEAAAARGAGLPSVDLDGSSEQHPDWWLAATQFIPGPPRKGDQEAAEGAAAEADGGAGFPAGEDAPCWPPPGAPGAGSGQAPVSDVVIPPDLPLEEITAEVLKSWKLRDTHVETLVQKVGGQLGVCWGVWDASVDVCCLCGCVRISLCGRTAGAHCAAVLVA